jgi:hypothetical protein
MNTLPFPLVLPVSDEDGKTLGITILLPASLPILNVTQDGPPDGERQPEKPIEGERKAA